MDLFIEYIKNLNSYLPLTEGSVHIVMGNESCDLDSTVCTLTLAYFLNKVSNDSLKVVPLLAVPKNELPLRTETIYVLNNIGIMEEDLIYIDSVNLEEMKQKMFELTLVDHHILPSNYQHFKDNVIQIFDHRPIDVESTWSENVRMNIQIVGSCSTLIANEIFNKDVGTLTPSMAKILYEAIIFDTIGLSPKAGKVKDLDKKICQQLEDILKINSEPRKLFDELWAAHINVSNLTPKQLLSRDLKVVKNILIPGLPMLVKEYLELSRTVVNDIKEFCEERKCNNMILMGLEAKGGVVQRDIAFYSRCQGGCNDLHLERIINRLKSVDELELEELTCKFVEIMYFRQHSKPSRKQIIPLIKEVLEEYE